MSATLDLILAHFHHGPEYYDLPLGTDLALFQFLCRLLQGHLTIPPDFIPPGYQTPAYKPIDRGLSVKIFGLTSLSVAVLVVVARLGTQSLCVAGGGIKVIRRNNRLGAWEGRTDSEWWKPWKRYGLRFGKLGWDDWVMVIALVFLAGYTTLNTLSVTYGGMGKHVYDVSLNSVKFLLKTAFMHSVLYLTLTFFIKLSILLFYLKLFPPAFIWMRRTIFFLITIFFVYMVVGTTITCLMCKPVRAFWTLELRAGDSCPSAEEVEKRYISLLAFHVLGDFLVLMLPMHLVSTLRLPKRQKVILIILFSAGGLACIASILRLLYFPRVNSSLDVSWNVTDVSLWGQVEASTAVICASIPSLKPLFSSLKSLRPNPPTDRPHHLPNPEMHFSNRITTGLTPSRGRAPDVINTPLSPNRGESVPLSPTRTSPISTYPAQIGIRDHNEIVLEEIDNIDDEGHFGEVKDDVHPGPSIPITPPRRVHESICSKSKLDSLDNQRNMIPASCSSNVSSLSLSTDSPQYLSVPQQNYLYPGQGHLRLSSLQTQSGESGITLVATKSSSKKSNSFNGSCQSSTPESVSISTSNAPPTLQVEPYHNAVHPPEQEEWSSPLATTATPYVYLQYDVLDTTGIDSYDGAEMV